MHFLTSSINSKSPSYFFFLASATSTQTNTIKRILANSKHCFIMRLSFPAGPPSQQKAVYLFRQKRNAYKTLSLPKRVRDFSRKKNPTRKKTRSVSQKTALSDDNYYWNHRTLPNPFSKLFAFKSLLTLVPPYTRHLFSVIFHKPHTLYSHEI